MPARWRNFCMSAKRRSGPYSAGACRQGECRNCSKSSGRQVSPCKHAIIEVAESGWLLSRCCRRVCAHYRRMCARGGGYYRGMCARGDPCYRAGSISLSSRYSYERELLLSNSVR
jgi:hypothetical protein